jgi:hypothetical protein
MKAFLSALASSAVLLVSVVGLAGTAVVVHPAGETDMGFLDVSSEPTGAKVLIDDADLGLTTPQHHLPVKAGQHHRLKLTTSDGLHIGPIGFSVEAGQTKKLTLYLGK